MKTLSEREVEEFLDKLHDALDPRGEGEDFTWDCEHDHTRTRKALADMGLSRTEIEAAVEEFERLCGHCDCEIMLNSCFLGSQDSS